MSPLVPDNSLQRFPLLKNYFTSPKCNIYIWDECNLLPICFHLIKLNSIEQEGKVTIKKIWRPFKNIIELFFGIFFNAKNPQNKKIVCNVGSVAAEAAEDKAKPADRVGELYDGDGHREAGAVGAQP